MCTDALSVEDGAILGLLFSCLTSSDPDTPKPSIPTLLSLFQSMRIPRISQLQTYEFGEMASWSLPDGPAQEMRDKAWSEIPIDANSDVVAM